MKKEKKISLSSIMTWTVVGIVTAALLAALVIFLSVYVKTMHQIAITNSEQAVVQVTNTVSNYTEDMKEIMRSIEQSYSTAQDKRAASMEALVQMRSDVVAVFCYDEYGHIVDSWTGGNKRKEAPMRDLSYMDHESDGETSGSAWGDEIYISSPHVESLLFNYYPWVVSIMQELDTPEGGSNKVVMDIRFSKIANYVDQVGIGQHGYCFIMDKAGNIVYHPQQQLIYSGLKDEHTDRVTDKKDGSFQDGNVIYTVKTMEHSDWRIVGVSYLEEVVTNRIKSVINILAILLFVVVITAFLSSIILSRMISRPIQGLVRAMSDFEKNAAEFSYHPVHGSSEIQTLSQSFEHMVVQIQELMTKVRNEEISLRKTELKALQAQINPHFLYNTLDAIGWMCEEERSKDAVEMVNALAKLFRISISKGHELITIEKELEHAKNYLMIQNFRYKNQFTYSFDVQESCLPYLCNKITLQPIVENAIYHGVDRMVDEGEIHIRIFEDGEDIIFQVEDNGVGMSEEQCRQILSHEPGEQAGIGIKNVNDRIKIYFGENYGLEIESELDVGTCVTIRMPKVREGDYETK